MDPEIFQKGVAGGWGGSLVCSLRKLEEFVRNSLIIPCGISFIRVGYYSLIIKKNACTLGGDIFLGS